MIERFSFRAGDIVRHFKGGLYEVLYLVIDTSNPDNVSVLYKALDGEDCGVIYSRSAKEFEEKFEKVTGETE